MTETRSVDIGAMIVRGVPPERVREHARDLAPQLDELWIVEDCFYSGGISQLSAVLDATNEIPIGHGIAPAPFRNPAALAMEWSTLARLHPGRLLCGLGHGVTEWMRQIGADVGSPVTLLRETTEAVCRLLRGETVTYVGDTVHLDDVRLEYPPTMIPHISLGVRGPVSLRLAGKIADGAILSEWSSPRYVEWARTHIDEGRRLRGRADTYRLTVFVGFCFADDPDALAATTAAAQVALDREDMYYLMWPDRTDRKHAPSIRDVMTTGLAIGSGDDIAAHLSALAASGADALILVPIGDPIAQLGRVLDEVVPLV